jgi:hypothetical protein
VKRKDEGEGTKQDSGVQHSWYVVLCLGVLLTVGCATSGTVGPGAVIRAEPPPPAEAPFQLTTPVGQISVPGEVQELVPGGAIDWSGMTVRARGTGVLDPGNSNRDQARQMAKRAATVVAQRNLLEIIKGVRVDSDTRVQDYMAEYDTVYGHVEGIVKGARPRGPAKYDSLGGTVEVELECDLYGETGVENAIMSLPAAGPPSSEVGAGGLSQPAREFLHQYSGLVLDGGDTGLKPALFPKVYDESGNLLLDPREHLVYADAPGTYAVQFVGTLDQVLARPEFAKLPLVLKVKEVRGKLGTDIVLGRGDADEVKGMKDGLEFLMDAGRILVKLVL